MSALASLVDIVFRIFSFLVLIEVLGSWILAAGARLPGWVFDVFQAVHNITAPVLNPVRRIIPPLGGLDFTPFIALLLLDLLRGVIVNALRGLY